MMFPNGQNVTLGPDRHWAPAFRRFGRDDAVYTDATARGEIDAGEHNGRSQSGESSMCR